MSENKEPKHLKPDLSIIIAAYNETNTIEKVIRQSQKEAEKITNDFEIIVCDDASTDNTLLTLSNLQKTIPRLKIIKHSKNLGLGPTLCDLFKASNGDFIQTMPGDYQMRPSEIPKFYKAIQSADLVCGCRINRKDSFYRLIISKIYNLFIKMLFGVKISDIGTIKMIRRTALETINPQSKTNFIEAELVIKTYLKGLKVTQVPIKYWPRKFGQASGGKFTVVFKIYIDLFKFLLFRMV